MGAARRIRGPGGNTVRRCPARIAGGNRGYRRGPGAAGHVWRPRTRSAWVDDQRGVPGPRRSDRPQATRRGRRRRDRLAPALRPATAGIRPRSDPRARTGTACGVCTMTLRDQEVLPFLRAIHDRPADDLPRHILPDFLDEHGDWRGPLFRRPAPAGAGRDVAATAAWLGRLEDLHGVSWAGCRRGLLSIVMPAAAVYELPDSHLLKEAFRQGWVEHLDLVDNAGIPWADQLDLNELPRLGFQRVEDETLENLPTMPALRELYLNNCRASRAELEWLNDFPRLKSLHITSWYEASNTDLARFLTAPHLRSLKLNGSNISNDGLQQIARLRELRKFHLCGSEVTDAGLDTLCALDQLEELRVSSRYLTDEALNFLAALPRLQRLGLPNDYGETISDAAIARFRATRPDVVVSR